ncbi:hypothetical protein AbraIFM66950_011182 [Aspergillus brasiliensis]|nr:hypothetical protein AbraIFM66950_011182 [Aspergillus brasiliensis]
MTISATPTPSLWAIAFSSLSEKDRRIFRLSDKSPPDTKQILTDILTAVEKQRDRCKRDKWTTISIAGKELVIRDVCAKIAAYVQKFMEVVDTAVQYDPVHAALPWAGVRFLLQLTFTAFETFGAIVEGLEKATRLIARCGILEALLIRYSGGATDAKVGLEEELVKLYSVVLDFLCKAKKHYDGSRLKRVLNLTSRQSLQELVQEMEAAEQRVLVMKGLVDSERMASVHDGISMMLLTVTSAANGVDNMETRLDQALADLDKPLVRISNDVSDLHNALQENERSELLQWLSTVPVQQHHREILGSVLAGSGEWLLNEPRFLNWKDSSSSETFWLHGIPGCGKTRLAALVIESLHQQSSGASKPAPIAHFFCSRSPAEPERSDAREILRSLVKQLSLIEGDKTIRLPSVEAYQVRRAEASHTGEKPAPLTVEECIDLICEIGRVCPLTLVIDALDECNPQQRGIVLQSLGDIRRRCRDVVKIFVSSRHQTDIAAHLDSGDVCEVTPAANEGDLTRFVKSRVKSFVKTWSTMHDEPMAVLQAIEKEIAEALLAGAQGMFLWVTLQLESISDTERIKDVESIHQALAALPSSLSKSYERIYERIQALGEGPKTVAMQSLQWLLCAKRKLSVGEFLAAVSKASVKSTSITARAIIDYCCNLVVFDNVEDTFRFAHVTVREFLETISEGAIFEANATISQRCLGTYLWGEFSEDGLVDYATRYWPAHVEQLSGSYHRSGIDKLLTEFFVEEEHFEDWIESLDERPVEQGYRWSNSLERKLEESSAAPPSPLFTIACFGLFEMLNNPEVIEMIDVNQTNKHGTSGVYLAARWGHAEVVRKLLHLGVGVNGPGYQYGSPLQAASFSGHEDVVKILLDHGATFSPTEKGEYSSPLHAALAGAHDNIARILIDSDRQLVNEKQFMDALDTASFKGYTEIVERLLDGKAGSFTPNIRPDPLQVALCGGKARQAKRLLQDCTDINEEKGYYGNALAAAIAGRKLALVQLVVDAGAKLDTRGRFGFPLRAATIANQPEIVRYLLEKGADPNIRDEELGDPLQAAASSGNLDIMLLLLSHNASVNGRGGHFGNALQAACFNGHEQAVRLLLDHGAALNRSESNVGAGKWRYRDALQAAVYAGHENIVKLLLTAGANLNPGRFDRVYPCSIPEKSKRIALPGPRAGAWFLDHPTELGPLEVAARRGNIGLVEFLLDQGANIDVQDAYSEDNEYHTGSAYTALQIAAFWGHTAVVECLLDRGADANAVRQTLGTPLHAALEGGHFDVADMLLSGGAEIDKHWGIFGSCLQVSSERGDIETVRFLLERDANIEDRGGENGNALQVACNAGHIDIIKLLLDSGADVRSPGRDIGNALQAASTTGHIEVVKLLLQHGIQVDEVDGNSETALCLAAENGDECMLNFLLKEGAKVDGNPVPPRDGDEHLGSRGKVKPEKDYLAAIPLHLAAVYGRESIVSILLQNGANVHVRGKLRTIETGLLNECEFSRLCCTPLFAACFWGHESIARQLFRHDPWGYTSRDTFTSAVVTGLAQKKKAVSTMLVQEAIRAGFMAEDLYGVFQYACDEGFAGIVIQILEHCDLKHWPDAIFRATERGRSAVVEALLHKGADKNARDKHGNICLDVTIHKIKEYRNTWWSFNSPDWIETLRVLLSAGADTDDLPNKIKEIVTDVIQRGSLEAWKALDRYQWDVLNDPTLYPKFLAWVSEKGDLDKIQYVAAKYDPSDEDIKSAVVSALQGVRNNVSPVEALLRLKTPVFFGETGDGDTSNEPLVIASSQGYSEIVDILLQYATHASSTIEAALKTSFRRRHVSCARLILDSQFKIQSRRLDICSRLIPSCFPYSSKDMLNYLFEQGVSPNTKHSETGETILYIAAMKNDSKGAKTLLAHGADIHLIGGEHGTPLHAAAISGSWKTVKLLLSASADINARGGSYGTPLIAVMAQKWTKTCWLAEFNKPCPWECHRCAARVLLEWDADVDAEGGVFGTALQAAKNVGNEVGMKMLMGDEDTCGGRRGAHAQLKSWKSHFTSS